MPASGLDGAGETSAPTEEAFGFQEEKRGVYLLTG